MNKPLNFAVLKNYRSKRSKTFLANDSVDTETSRFFDFSTKMENNAIKCKISPTMNLNHEITLVNDQQPDNIKTNNNSLLHWVPVHWEQQLNNIKQMRKNRTAPVDEMGCDKCADRSAENSIFRFQTLVSLILSTQTRDYITHSSMQRLKQVNCTPKDILLLSDDELGKLIYPVSFWKVYNILIFIYSRFH